VSWEVKGGLPVATVILTGRTATVLYREASQRGGGGVKVPAHPVKSNREKVIRPMKSSFG